MSFSRYEDMVSAIVYKNKGNGSSNTKQRAIILKAVMSVINEKLTDRQKQILHLYFFEKMNITQIAEDLFINKSTVSRTLARAIKKINDYTRYYLFR